ncbi:peptidoglycan-binding protein CsiV [Thiogranum longum]|uniref:Peptidoglycan-binding protein CsiV n=1 Tax=Thiogranum longum TaxID=1537524 RepID=A0A4R1HDK7_9GAMM|nr:CsiV family protein [Thiogranum longum]TCK18385.1 peptidoglycan-binding protein CsiV [Thiogranum longum]
MIKFTRRVFYTLFLFNSLISPILADDAPRQFDIELLIFQNLSASDGGEVWPVDYSEWFTEDTTGSNGEGTRGAPRTGKRLNNPFWLDRQNLHLAAEQVALKRSANYRPLRHIAWRQTVLDRKRAQAIELPPGGNQFSTTVEGTVRVAVERYLHLYLDLQLIDKTLVIKTDFSDNELPEFRLKEHRRMRSKELHYFDHPKFGVIALITPYTPAPSQAETAKPPATESPTKNPGQ